MGKKILIAGASGMIGSLVLEASLRSEEVGQVVSLVRKSSGASHAKLVEIQAADMLNLPEGDYLKNVDAVYYCIGVYTGAVPTEQFRQITVDFPQALANVVHQHSPQARFILLSGQGADRSEQSRMMFARDKGAIENILSAQGFKAFHAFRPGYIYPVTPRKEPNLSYRISRALYPLLKHFGDKFSVTSEQLAASMFYGGIHGCEQEIMENKDIVRLARTLSDT